MKAVKVSLMTAFVLATLVALSPVSRAQETKEKDSAKPSTGQSERRPNSAAQFDRFATELKLTDEQKTKVQPIYKEQATKLRELRQDTTLTSEQRRTKAGEIREQYLAKLKPILTPEQSEQLKKMRQQGRGTRASGAAGTKPTATDKKAP